MSTRMRDFDGRVGMKHTFLIGLAATIIGGVGLFVGGALGLSFNNTVMGVGGGVIAAVVPLGPPLARLGGFLIGFLLGAFFSLLELGLLPGGASVAGSAVALVVVLLVITFVAAVTSGRISAWSMLLGAVVFVAGFMPVIETAPWTASAQLGSSFFTLLAMAAIGWLTIIPVELLAQHPRQTGATTANPAATPAPDAPPGPELDESGATIGQLMSGAK